MSEIDLPNNTKTTIIVNNEAAISIQNIDGDIVLGGIGWTEQFDWEKRKYGKALSIIDCVEMGFKLQKIEGREAEVIHGRAKVMWNSSKQLKEATKK